MSDASIVTLLYECHSSEEYSELIESEKECEIHLSHQESPKTLKMWTEVLQLRVGHVNTLADWMTFQVDIRPPYTQTDLYDVTRRVVTACVVGSRDRDGYPEALKVVVGEIMDGVTEESEDEEPVVKVVTKEPEDYHFLKWVWDNLDDFWKGDSSIIEEAYTERTGKDSPYEEEQVVRMRKMIRDYKVAIGDDCIIEPPYLVEHLAYETDDLPRDEEVLKSLGDAISTYYSPRYSSGLLNANKTIRAAVKKTDKLWSERLRWCTAWKYGWELGDEDVELEMGSTCETALDRWKEEYEQLCILEPNKRYPVVKEGDYYVYDVDTLPLYTDERWDQQLVDESIKEGHVVGVFAYTSIERAEEAQNRRLLTLPTSLLPLL